MAKVTKEFKDNYDFWIARKIEGGEFTKPEADELKVMIRKDLTEGPDQLRAGIAVITAAGIEMPVTIDDHEERFRLWDAFFSVECQEMRCGSASGINPRIRSSIAAAKESERKAV